MGWLRRDKDCISLVVVWALLLQAALLSFASGAMAASLAGGDNIVLCTAKGAIVGRQLPGQSHQKADCQYCAMACRLACGGASSGIALDIRVPLPVPVEAPVRPGRVLEYRVQSAEISPAQPRAPPLS